MTHKVVYLLAIVLKTDHCQLTILLSMLLTMLLVIKLEYCMKIFDYGVLIKI